MLVFIKRCLFIFLIIAFLWAAGLVWFISTIPTSSTDDTSNTEAIVVLTGGSLRLEHGLSLLIQNKAPVLFISGVDEGLTLSSLLREKGLSNIAAQVPQDRVEIGYYAHSTLQNAEEVKYWVNKRHIKTIRLVTGNYHMPRSLYEMREAMPDVGIIADPVFPPEFSSGYWWLSGYSLRLAMSEYHKYMASVIAHMLGIISNE